MGKKTKKKTPRAGARMISEPPKLPQRQRDAHKGSFGRVLIVGGSGGMIGAVALAANGALRAGAGLVTFAAPRTVQPTIAGLCPCATSVPLACDQDGALSAEAVRQAAAAADRADVLAIGPGMGVGTVQKDMLSWALGCDRPLVVDADGLNNLATIEGWQQIRNCPLVLTPHPGEFSRLTGKDVREIQGSREDSARRAAIGWTKAPQECDAPLVCLLKGAGTVVTDGRRMYVNSTGNPGMASGGTGDVLTGVVAALIGQGLEPFEAACLGAHVHGRAGDLAAQRLCEASLIATDLLEFLPEAMKESCG